jgi:hypothetical protein
MVQDYKESDLLHVKPNDFENEKTWKPIYDYITTAYKSVSTIDGNVLVYRLE